MGIYDPLCSGILSPSQVRLDVPMSRFTTFRVGGPADCLVDVASEESLLKVLDFAHSRNLPLTVIGNGSNLLVRDGGIRGIVLRISSLYNRIDFSGETSLTAEAGTSLSSLAQQAAARSLAGLVPLSGIPGTLGGAILMNAGAYGGEIGPLIESVRGISLTDLTIHFYNKEELAFSYRHSSLMELPVLITGATLSLAPGSPETLHAQMQELATRRREKQPLEYPSAGSTFKRPEGAFAAKLIDDCGLRGLRVGDAQVSEKHCGFVINRGNATASEILSLMKHIQDTVFARTGYRLEPEVRILGEDPA